MKAAGVGTTFALIGKYLSLKDSDEVGPIELADRFYYWLKSVVPTNAKYRSGIVRSICEKVNITFPGLYDADAYEEGA